MSIVFSLRQVNFPRAYSAGVMASDVIELMTVSMISVELLSAEKSRREQSAEIAQRETISS